MTLQDTIRESMKRNAEQHGYFLCPDQTLLNDLIEGLATNTTRYGYGSCPCRVASGIKNYDVDIICPCEYRDADVNEFGMCYCGLFVNEEINITPSQMKPIPERRPQEIIDAAVSAAETKHRATQKTKKHSLPEQTAQTPPVWRCTVCGYLCARELPPPICPICKAKAERFEIFPLD
jgi:ferredoxin-thioredoxin reductase catalytic chain